MSRGKPQLSLRDWEVKQLRRIRQAKQVCFETLLKTSQGFGRANTQETFVPERRCTNTEKSSSGLYLALRSR